MFVLLVVGGILMILLGFIGVYVGFIFQEVKRRPIYLVRQKIGPQPPLPTEETRSPQPDHDSITHPPAG